MMRRGFPACVPPVYPGGGRQPPRNPSWQSVGAGSKLRSLTTLGRIVTTGVPGMATKNPLGRFVTPPQGAMLANRLDRIGTARRCEAAAGAGQRADDHLIPADQRDEQRSDETTDHRSESESRTTRVGNSTPRRKRIICRRIDSSRSLAPRLCGEEGIGREGFRRGAHCLKHIPAGNRFSPFVRRASSTIAANNDGRGRWGPKPGR